MSDALKACRETSRLQDELRESFACLEAEKLMSARASLDRHRDDDAPARLVVDDAANHALLLDTPSSSGGTSSSSGADGISIALLAADDDSTADGEAAARTVAELRARAAALEAELELERAAASRATPAASRLPRSPALEARVEELARERDEQQAALSALRNELLREQVRRRRPQTKRAPSPKSLPAAE